jgi:hypothetical protein
MQHGAIALIAKLLIVMIAMFPKTILPNIGFLKRKMASGTLLFLHSEWNPRSFSSNKQALRLYKPTAFVATARYSNPKEKWQGVTTNLKRGYAGSVIAKHLMEG